MKETGVLLGRFSPLHRGHQDEVDFIVGKHGKENTLIMIGSSDSYNFRTPFSYEQRKDIIEAVYPDLKIIPLPDIKTELIYFDGSSNDKWLASIREIEKEMEATFIFYGGSKEDLAVLAQVFETSISVSRHDISRRISATDVRRALDSNDDEKLKSFLDPKIISLVKKYYSIFQESQKNEK